MYGPTDVREKAGMAVQPHPHLELQTVSRLVQGTVLGCLRMRATASTRASFMSSVQWVATASSASSEFSARDLAHGDAVLAQK